MFLKFAEVKAVCHRSMLKGKKKQKLEKKQNFTWKQAFQLLL